MHLVYHEGYDLKLGNHVFPSTKFRRIRDSLLAEGAITPDRILAPEAASRGDLLLVHGEAWIDGLVEGTLSPAELARLEIPWSPEMARGFLLAAGGTTLAARTALQERICYNIGGGFHHAFANHGEGFCAINDIAVAIRVLQRDGAIRRAMVIDCDVHHGNGTASIFRSDESVYTISVQQLNNYPAQKPASTLDIHLDDGIGDEEYLCRLDQGIRDPLRQFAPELVVYVAGADPYEDDQLGGLALTMDGLLRRDQLVLNSALQNGTAVAVVLAGGYARRLTDTVTIHCNTAKAAMEAAK